MNLSAPINELKRKAKLLRRSEGIALNQAVSVRPCCSDVL